MSLACLNRSSGNCWVLVHNKELEWFAVGAPRCPIPLELIPCDPDAAAGLFVAAGCVTPPVPIGTFPALVPVCWARIEKR